MTLKTLLSNKKSDSFVNRELQINIHPNDCKHFEVILRHQIRVWGTQIDRIRLTLDLHNSQSGRYHSEVFQENLESICFIIEKLANEYPFIVVDQVDTSESNRREIAKQYFNKEDVPIKAWDGGPFYSYLYGLWKSRAKTIIHIDSDMMFGGLSETWLDEAEKILKEDSNVLFIAPLSGPPHPDRILFGHKLQGGGVFNEYLSPHSYTFNSVSTRIFVTQSELIKKRLGYLDWVPPSFIQKIKSFLLGNPSISKEFEVVLSKTLQNHNLKRVDYLGTGPGMWSIHPPFRSELFYKELPNLIHRIESGNIPKEQLGKYDLDDCLFDWTIARKKNSGFQRKKRQISRMFNRFF